MGPAVRVAGHVAAVAAGGAVGVLGSFVHPLTWFGLPYGLLLGLVLTAALVVSAGIAARSRTGALAAFAGWLVAVGLLSVQRSEGDLVVPATALGYCWLLGGTVVAGLALALPYWMLSGASMARPGAPAAPSGAERIGR